MWHYFFCRCKDGLLIEFILWRTKKPFSSRVINLDIYVKNLKGWENFNLNSNEKLEDFGLMFDIYIKANF
jgi:hypothetical protein